jgi:lipid A 3-O-deacylase
MLPLVPDNSTPTHQCNQLEFKMSVVIPLNSSLLRKALLQFMLATALIAGWQQPLLAATQQGDAMQPRHQLHLAYLQGEGDVQGLKVAVQKESPFFTQYLHDYGLLGTVSFEMSANFWRYGPENDTDQNLVLAVSPVLTFPLGKVFEKELLAEFGIGVSLLDDTRFAGKNVSTHYQFEDRLGLIYRLNNQDSLSLRYLHYSNAGFKKPNPGLDFIALGYSRAF